MHFSPSSSIGLAASALFATAVNAAHIKVNYYSDGGCSDYMISIYPSTDWTCYDYNWSGQNSVGIAECTFPNGVCYCDFYTHGGCSGASIGKSLSYSGSDPGWCASNWGHGFESMRCGVIHDP
ncbi:hypothetical protein F5144DRAFT_534118 [Chaetomium tenue]|uniref:Uncharacterized protein n=1 Tax=Chaetomium tenue TaxID=1854479 RepID=A0ACB7P882_9PEZI|nr:hypothetical protein F5144DRAFT_534118 [Chaetomium globosum]